MTPTPNEEARPEAIIAGTLCLMSCFVQHPATVYADRVASNLALMAQLAALSPEMRAVCQRLSKQWDAIRRDADPRVAANGPAIDERSLH
jgi:hypothetical protein